MSVEFVEMNDGVRLRTWRAGSVGVELSSKSVFFLFAHPDRVAGVVYLSGPFLGNWREARRAVQRERHPVGQQARLDELAATEHRSEPEEIEFLTLSWFTDHSDPDRAWEWAADAARALRQPGTRLGLEVTLISDAGHGPWLEKPDELRAELRRAVGKQLRTFR